MGLEAARRAIFWDRDGTLMREVEYCGRPDLVEAVGGAGEWMRRLASNGWLHVLVTNQSGIGRGYFTEDDFWRVNAELFRQLGIEADGVYFCADVPPSGGRRRKPSPAMVFEACRDLGIEAARSWFIGDKAVDVECGRRAGCRTILVLTGYGEKELGMCCPDFVEVDAVAACERIAREEALL